MEAKSSSGLKFAILSISFLLMVRLTISPALAEIGKAFPTVSQGSLMNMVAVASMVAIPFGLLSSILARYMRKRTLLLIGLILYIIGGLGPIFATDFNTILIFRAFLGAGTGFFIPLATGLIADFFTGDERNNMIGYQSTAVGVGNIVTAILAGVLAAIAWNLSFLIYGFAIIVLLLAYYKITEPEKILHVVSEKSINAKVLFICFATMLYAVIYFSFFGYLSFVVDNLGLGGAASTGFATMLMTLGSMIMGVIFWRFTKILKNFQLFVALLLNVVGFFLLSIAASMAYIIIGSIFIGLGFGFFMPTVVLKVTDASAKSAITFSNGLLMTFINIGTAISPFILVFIGDVFKNPDGQFIYQFCSILLLIAAVIALVFAFVPQKAEIESVSI